MKERHTYAKVRRKRSRKSSVDTVLLQFVAVLLLLAIVQNFSVVVAQQQQQDNGEETPQQRRWVESRFPFDAETTVRLSAASTTSATVLGVTAFATVTTSPSTTTTTLFTSTSVLSAGDSSSSSAACTSDDCYTGVWFSGDTTTGVTSPTPGLQHSGFKFIFGDETSKSPNTDCTMGFTLAAGSPFLSVGTTSTGTSRASTLRLSSTTVAKSKAVSSRSSSGGGSSGLLPTDMLLFATDGNRLREYVLRRKEDGSSSNAAGDTAAAASSFETLSASVLLGSIICQEPSPVQIDGSSYTLFTDDTLRLGSIPGNIQGAVFSVYLQEVLFTQPFAIAVGGYTAKLRLYAGTGTPLKSSPSEVNPFLRNDTTPVPTPVPSTTPPSTTTPTAAPPPTTPPPSSPPTPPTTPPTLPPAPTNPDDGNNGTSDNTTTTFRHFSSLAFASPPSAAAHDPNAIPSENMIFATPSVLAIVEKAQRHEDIVSPLPTNVDPVSIYGTRSYVLFVADEDLDTVFAIDLVEESVVEIAGKFGKRRTSTVSWGDPSPLCSTGCPAPTTHLNQPVALAYYQPTFTDSSSTSAGPGGHLVRFKNGVFVAERGGLLLFVDLTAWFEGSDSAAASSTIYFIAGHSRQQQPGSSPPPDIDGDGTMASFTDIQQMVVVETTLFIATMKAVRRVDMWTAVTPTQEVPQTPEPPSNNSSPTIVPDDDESTRTQTLPAPTPEPPAPTRPPQCGFPAITLKIIDEEDSTLYSFALVPPVETPEEEEEDEEGDDGGGDEGDSPTTPTTGGNGTIIVIPPAPSPTVQVPDWAFREKSLRIVVGIEDALPGDDTRYQMVSAQFKDNVSSIKMELVEANNKGIEDSDATLALYNKKIDRAARGDGWSRSRPQATFITLKKISTYHTVEDLAVTVTIPADLFECPWPTIPGMPNFKVYRPAEIAFRINSAFDNTLAKHTSLATSAALYVSFAAGGLLGSMFMVDVQPLALFAFSHDECMVAGERRFGDNTWALAPIGKKDDAMLFLVSTNIGLIFGVPILHILVVVVYYFIWGEKRPIKAWQKVENERVSRLHTLSKLQKKAIEKAEKEERERRKAEGGGGNEDSSSSSSTDSDGDGKKKKKKKKKSQDDEAEKEKIVVPTPHVEEPVDPGVFRPLPSYCQERHEEGFSKLPNLGWKISFAAVFFPSGTISTVTLLVIGTAFFSSRIFMTSDAAGEMTAGVVGGLFCIGFAFWTMYASFWYCDRCKFIEYQVLDKMYWQKGNSATKTAAATEMSTNNAQGENADDVEMAEKVVDADTASSQHGGTQNSTTPPTNGSSAAKEQGGDELDGPTIAARGEQDTLHNMLLNPIGRNLMCTIFLPKGRWTPPLTRIIFAALLDPYRGGMGKYTLAFWIFIHQSAIPGFIGFAFAVQPETQSGCVIQSGVIAGGCFLIALAEIFQRPFRTLFLNLLNASGLIFTGMVFVGAVIVAQNPDTFGREADDILAFSVFSLVIVAFTRFIYGAMLLLIEERWIATREDHLNYVQNPPELLDAEDKKEADDEEEEVEDEEEEEEESSDDDTDDEDLSIEERIRRRRKKRQAARRKRMLEGGDGTDRRRRGANSNKKWGNKRRPADGVGAVGVDDDGSDEDSGEDDDLYDVDARRWKGRLWEPTVYGRSMMSRDVIQNEFEQPLLVVPPTIGMHSSSATTAGGGEGLPLHAASIKSGANNPLLMASLVPPPPPPPPLEGIFKPRSVVEFGAASMLSRRDVDLHKGEISLRKRYGPADSDDDSDSAFSCSSSNGGGHPSYSPPPPPPPPQVLENGGASSPTPHSTAVVDVLPSPEPAAAAAAGASPSASPSPSSSSPRRVERQRLRQKCYNRGIERFKEFLPEDATASTIHDNAGIGTRDLAAQAAKTPYNSNPIYSHMAQKNSMRLKSRDEFGAPHSWRRTLLSSAGMLAEDGDGNSQMKHSAASAGERGGKTKKEAHITSLEDYKISMLPKKERKEHQKRIKEQQREEQKASRRQELQAFRELIPTAAPSDVFAELIVASGREQHQQHLDVAGGPESPTAAPVTVVLTDDEIGEGGLGSGSGGQHSGSNAAPPTAAYYSKEAFAKVMAVDENRTHVEGTVPNGSSADAPLVESSSHRRLVLKKKRPGTTTSDDFGGLKDLMELVDGGGDDHSLNPQQQQPEAASLSLMAPPPHPNMQYKETTRREGGNGGGEEITEAPRLDPLRLVSQKERGNTTETAPVGDFHQLTTMVGSSSHQDGDPQEQPAPSSTTNNAAFDLWWDNNL